MLRNEWGFEYTARDLAAAAATKLAHHRERFDWWTAKRQAVMSEIRSDGIEIDEAIVTQYRSLKSRDWERSSQVLVRNDLQKDLAECLEKLAHHTQQIEQYDGWQQVLEANPGQVLRLDIEDWLFFFRRT